MDQHQRDEWGVLVRSAFRSDADISIKAGTHRFDDFVATVSWPLPTAERPNRLSKQIRLVITREALCGYFEKDESAREHDKQKVEKWIRNNLESFDANHEVPRDQPLPQVDWIIGTEVLNS